MKRPLLHIFSTAILLFAASFQSASAYSPIATIDGWHKDRLKNFGITIEALDENISGTEIGQKWVRVHFNTSKRENDERVLMLLNIRNEKLETISSVKVEHRTGDEGDLSLDFACRQENLENSDLTIYYPDRPIGPDFGNPGLIGLRLSLKTILTHAIKAPEPKPKD